MSPKGFCPFSLFLFAVTAGIATTSMSKSKKSSNKKKQTPSLPACTVIFVVGAPGTGKGTQCQLLIEKYPQWTHLSAGDLLRAERKRAQAAQAGKGDGGDLELANTIEACINAGQLVPSSITVRLLEKGMTTSFAANGATHFLVDGFPRGQDNIDAWDAHMTPQQHRVVKVLDFTCPEEVLVGRLLERGKSSGRSDDNIETIRKRFATHVQACKPVLERYTNDGILETIGSDRSVDEIFAQVETVVMESTKKQ
ncbi:Adenylate kinase [Seminavis robusta]|uniref:Adenylate kinase n=1 Tax=Seminavis robusta TaxID=568900 RepID=A0A9N8H0C9_9STRA|nr:Adenylate kinase [Seminavis robusta]|eukprot:Sro18_g013140.1 Adenylate kinase (253) ;mRNA; r:163456-164214